MQLPNGLVTFLLTDVERSTHMWEADSAAMELALARHDQLALSHVAEAGGVVVKPRGEGDSLFIVFARAVDAVTAAVRLQQAFLDEPWSETISATGHASESGQSRGADQALSDAAPNHCHSFALHVRMAVHTGHTQHRDGDYYGLTVNRCARIRSVGHGRQVLLSRATYELVHDRLPDSISLVDLGSHRLRDLQHPEHLYQVSCDGWRAEFPPLASLQTFTNNLPQQLTSFIGRDEEITEVRELLGHTRLLTLTGSGGCGKTRLALQLAAEVLEDYIDGVWLIELAALTASEQVPKAIATALRIPERPGSALLDSLSEHLRDRSILLLLDNCEHLLETCAQIIYRLLRACPQLKILTTSRSRLNVSGEHVWPVPTFPVPAAGALSVGEALQIASISLFVERATSAHPRFMLTERSLAPVAQVCRRLDGIPLAIELAAARVSVLTPEQISKRLETSFRLLTSGDRTVLERHQTLDAMIAWSYNLLSPSERALLRRLVVFTGGWTLEAAEQVCSGDGIEEEEVLDLLSHLVDASLVIAEEREDSERYRLLETVRQYGRERLEETGESEAAANRHLDYFLRLAEEAEPQLTGPNQAEWLDRLDADHDNLRTALQWAVDPDTRLRLAGSLWRFWANRGYFHEGRSWLEGALVSRHRLSASTCAKALNGAGVLATRQSDHALALNWLKESLELREELNDTRGVAETLSNLGNLARMQKDYSEARSLYEQSLALRQQLRDDWGLAASLSNIGMVLLDLKQPDEATPYMQRSLEIYRQLGDAANIASVSVNLGLIALAARDYDAARPLFKDSVSIFRSMQNRWGLAIALHNLGQAYFFGGDLARSRLCYRESLSLRAGLRDMPGVARLLAALAVVALRCGALICAVRLFAVARTMQESQGYRLPDDDPGLVNDGIDEAKTRLGEEAFAEQWQHGQNMTVELAVSYALVEIEAIDKA